MKRDRRSLSCRQSRREVRRGGLLLAVTLTAACAVNPVSGRRELALVSESQEIAMGQQGAADVKASIGLYADAPLQAYVNQIGQTLAAKTERAQLAWEFHVLDDASVNAFALPGGFIFITRGLLTHLTNEAELASVLGHEAGHVAARHSVQQMSQQQLMSLGLGLGSVLSPTIAKYGQIAGAGLQMLSLSHSRGDETQADELGFRYALVDGYDMREMAGVFEMLQREGALSGDEGRLPEWQSTHPDPGNRITHVQSMVAATTESFATKKVGGPAFLQHLNGVVYGEDPRAGYFQGGLFIHPALAFVLRFPDGWQTRNAVDAVTGGSPGQDAIIQLAGAQGTAAAAAAKFASEEGLQASAPSQRTINGNRAVSLEFAAQSGEGQSVRGIATFIEYGGNTWAITAFAAAARFGAYSSAFQATTNSFARLTNAAALATQPKRVRIDAAPRAMSLQQFNAALPSTIPLAELAIINGLAEGAQLTAGQSIKRVTGAAPPTVSAVP